MSQNGKPEKAQICTTMDATLLFHFKKFAQTQKMNHEGSGKGGLQTALEEAIRDYLKKHGVDPNAPLPFFAQQKIEGMGNRDAKTTGRIFQTTDHPSSPVQS